MHENLCNQVPSKNLKQVLHLAKALVMKLPVVAVVKVVIEDLVTVIVQKEKIIC